MHVFYVLLIKNLSWQFSETVWSHKFSCMQTFAQTISNKMFHSDYKHITDKLPESLVKKAYQSLLNQSKNPVPLEMISGKSNQIESYLRHKLEVYKNSLNRKYKSN